MQILIAICLVALCAVFLTAVLRIVLSDRKARLAYVKNFKKGKFAVIFFIAVPLYWMAHYEGGVDVGGAFLQAVKSTVDLVVLKFDYASVRALMAENMLYRVTMSFCFALVIANAVMFAFALIGERIANRLRALRAVWLAPELFVVVGYNEQNLQIIRSVRREKGDVVLLAPLDRNVLDDLYVLKSAGVSFSEKGDLAELLRRWMGRIGSVRINVIINTGCDTRNLILTEAVGRVLEELDQSGFGLGDRKGLQCYVFGEPRNESAFLRFVEKHHGGIRYINKYKLIARDFIERYPLTSAMDARHIDYDSATLYPDVRPKMFLIGFGKTNRQLFMTSVANQQFLTRGEDGRPVEKPVQYFIFDKTDAVNDKQLNHNLYRYDREFVGKVQPDRYLPLPPFPAEERFFRTDVNERSFYETLCKELSDPDAVSDIVIAFGSDLENLDLAEKLSEKIKEWDVAGHTRIFVKIRDGALCEKVIDKLYAQEAGFYTFGNEKEAVYDLRRIVSERAETMAQLRHFRYTLDRFAKEPVSEDERNRLAAREAALEWYDRWSEVQRESNIFACMGLRIKLNLTGYDYAEGGETGEGCDAAFLAHYSAGDPIRYVDGRDGHVVDYSGCPKTLDSLRCTMARQEHQRWNAYMICNGYLPASLDAMVSCSKQELLARREHRNLTTFEGLLQYRKTMAERNGISEDEADVTRYDYQIMDDVLWLLPRCGLRLVPKQDKAPLES